MKKRFHTMRWLLLSVACLSACTGNYEHINTPPYDATEEDMTADDYKIQGALTSMQGWGVPFAEHDFQFVDVLLGATLGGYLAEHKGWTEKISTYNPTYDWTEVAFKNIVSGIFIAHTQLRGATDDPVPLAVAEIVKVAALHRVTDIYGPIPYSQVGHNGELTAPYDAQKSIYEQMFAALDKAVATLTAHRAEALNPKADRIFGGDLTGWIRYANSLKLRLAVRTVYADPEGARRRAEEAVLHEVGVMTDNAHNATAVHPVQNLYFLLTQQWGDYRAAADIVSCMNGYDDPRRERYFALSTFTAADGAGIVNGYYGLRRGIKGSDASQGAGYSNMSVDKTTPMRWMNAAEVAFLRAEGALRGWSMGADAQTLYERGIALSFEEWGVANPEAYAAGTSKPGDYVDPKLGYSASAMSTVAVRYDAADDFERNLERIVTQKWIACWRTTGVEAWSEFRRTGYPRLWPSPHNQSGGVIAPNAFARRMAYPQDEYAKNPVHYREAVATLLGGPDDMATRVWWDCNPNTKNR